MELEQEQEPLRSVEEAEEQEPLRSVEEAEEQEPLRSVEEGEAREPLRSVEEGEARELRHWVAADEEQVPPYAVEVDSCSALADGAQQEHSVLEVVALRIGWVGEAAPYSLKVVVALCFGCPEAQLSPEGSSD